MSADWPRSGCTDDAPGAAHQRVEGQHRGALLRGDNTVQVRLAAPGRRRRTSAPTGHEQAESHPERVGEPEQRQDERADRDGPEDQWRRGAPRNRARMLGAAVSAGDLRAGDDGGRQARRSEYALGSPVKLEQVAAAWRRRRRCPTPAVNGAASITHRTGRFVEPTVERGDSTGAPRTDGGACSLAA